MAWSARRTALTYGFRSGLEEDVAASLEARGVAYTFESLVLEFVQPSKPRKYTPDFVLKTASGKEIIVETKGRWLRADRMKMKLVVAQHPNRDIRMVFQRPNEKIAKGSHTTYAEWCHKHLGILWAAGDIPDAWILE